MTSGTKTASNEGMRALIALVLLGGCLGGGGSKSASRPAVMPMLSELPSDPTKRDAVLDSASTTAGPEQRKGMTAKERKVETAAATAAAILGSMFSSTQSVTIGAASQFDESELIAPQAMPALQPAPSATGDDTVTPGASPTNDPDAPIVELLPWIRLR